MGESCDTDSDCDGVEFCDALVCNDLELCVSTADCDDGEYCENDVNLGYVCKWNWWYF